MRAGVRAVLHASVEFELVGEAADGASTVQAVAELSPDVVLIDLAIEGASALDTVNMIKKRRPLTKVLTFTSNRSRDYVVSALRAGADGFLLKEATVSELLMAMRAVLAGHTYLSPQIAGHVVSAFVDDGPSVAPPQTRPLLSQREKQVLQLVATGRTSKEIASDLFISPRTVEKHRARLMQTLKVKSIAAVIAPAIGTVLHEANAEAATASEGPTKTAVANS